jgi:hypothetical protein
MLNRDPIRAPRNFSGGSGLEMDHGAIPSLGPKGVKGQPIGLFR